MLKISKMTDYATSILTHLAENQDQTTSTTDIAKVTHISLPTVCNLLKKLTPLVTSQRGTKGGYRLATKPNQITLVSIINKIEGPIAITECSHSNNHCDKTAICRTQKNWQTINRTINSVLEQLTLADLQTELHEHPVILSHLYPPTRVSNNDKRK